MHANLTAGHMVPMDQPAAQPVADSDLRQAVCLKLAALLADNPQP